MIGLTTEGHTNALGEFNHGYFGFTCAGHRAADRGAARKKTIRQNKSPHLEDYAEEYSGTCHLPAHHHLYFTLCWYVNSFRFRQYRAALSNLWPMMDFKWPV